MTTEEKAKAYDKAIEKIKYVMDRGVEPILNKADLQSIFPELMETNDGQSKKWILEYLYDGLRKSDEQFKGQFKAAIAWLEKQKRLTTEEYEQGKEDVLWCIEQAKKHSKDENEMGTCWFAEKWLKSLRPHAE